MNRLRLALGLGAAVMIIANTGAGAATATRAGGCAMPVGSWFDRQNWKVKSITSGAVASGVRSLTSPDGDMGYPGEVPAAACARQPRAPLFIEPPGYARHRPETTLQHRLVEQHYPVLCELRSMEGRSLPDYVEQEFDAYLRCGRLEERFLRVRSIGAAARRTGAAETGAAYLTRPKPTEDCLLQRT